MSDDRALDGPMGAAHWRAYGELLATVHATAATDELASLLPREDHTHGQLASTARALELDWPAIAGVISSLLDHADRLGRELLTGEAPIVICHGDPHLGNVLLGGDDQVWLVDWDDAVLAPRELDLMFVIGGVLAFAPVTVKEHDWFFAGYGAADLDPARLAYYRCTRALIDLVDPAAQAADVRLSERERAHAMSIVEGVLSPTGLATLALSSVGNAGHGRRP